MTCMVCGKSLDQRASCRMTGEVGRADPPAGSMVRPRRAPGFRPVGRAGPGIPWRGAGHLAAGTASPGAPTPNSPHPHEWEGAPADGREDGGDSTVADTATVA